MDKIPFLPLNSKSSCLPNESGGVNPLPCLYCNNSNEKERENGQAISDSPLNCSQADDFADGVISIVNQLQPHHKKQAAVLAWNVASLIRHAPSFTHVGMLTLTVPDNCTDPKEFARRWNSFRTGYLSDSSFFTGEWLLVKERQRRGAIHAHIIVITTSDIRTGCDFKAFADESLPRGQRYSSAPLVLRQIWKELRSVLPRYNFGRSELIPIKSTAEAVSFYVGKYLGKHIEHRFEEDKGMRLIECSKGWSKNSVKFAWNTPGSYFWRRYLAIFALLNGCSNLDDLKEKFGRRYAHKVAPYVFAMQERMQRNIKARIFNQVSELTSVSIRSGA